MSERSLQDLRAQAQQLMQQGRAAEAETLFRQVVTHSPRDADAWHSLGILCAQTGRFAEAEALIRSAITLSPRTAAYHANLGNVLQELGKVDEAVASYEAALTLDPNLAIARSNLANALQRLGRFAEAVENYRTALRITPDNALIWVNLGNAQRALGQHLHAAESYQQALNIQPRYLDAALGLAVSQLDSEQINASFDSCRRALAIDSNCQPARQMLGSVLRALGRPNDAIIPLREVTRREPARWETWHEFGGALREAGDLGGSVDAYHRAIALNPNYAGAHYGLAWSLLQQGDYPAGFAEYEWRERLESAPRRPAGIPRWDGPAGAHQRVVIVAEQGFGDCFMAYRYLPQVRERVGEVILQCPAPLRQFFAEQPAGYRVIDNADSIQATSYCPMMSLPRIFGTRVETIPAQNPYLQADAVRSAKWRERLRADDRNIGLVWAGNASPRHRSISPDELAPLNSLPGVRFHSLQGGATARTINAACTALSIVDWSAELVDFAEVAALIANLDCVVTIDTAVAHLAGAMGKRALVLLNYAPDWRWFSDRTDSPWYPSVKLFRQKSPLDWKPVLAEVVAELGK